VPSEWPGTDNWRQPLTTFFLLTGAGFTRNWGGPLVGEVFQQLLAAPEVSATAKKLLWAAEDHGGYEEVLEKLQGSKDIQDVADLQPLLSGLLSMFTHLRDDQRSLFLDFSNDLERTITVFLSKFEAIFTLNQDVFLETHYTPQLGVWDGWALPGTKTLGSIDEKPQLRAPADYFENAGSRIQPYYKLHGSMHFHTSADGNGTPLMIAGGNKLTAINQQGLLRWYFDRFKDYLARPDARLMVIGYSFSDEHINAALEQATHNGLKLYVIDPRGTKVLDKRDWGASIVRLKDDQQEALEAAVIGASKRPLSESFGPDVVEWSNIMRFFK
jgi:hypothetical protein